MKVKSIKDIKDLKGKKALVRVDYNLSINNGKIDFKDNLRIKASLATINYLLKEGADVILVAHLGRPEGWDKKLSLAPVAKYLAKILKKQVNFIADDITKKDVLKKIKKGVNMLENIRFYTEETKGDKKFSKLLSDFGDVYINEGFSVSHREDASVWGVQSYLPPYAGLNLEAEILNLSKLLRKNLKKQNRPYVALMGGGKISTKVNLILSLLKSADCILLGGALISGILKLQGYKLGKTLQEEISPSILKKIFRNKKIVMPVDVVVGRAERPEEARVIRLEGNKALCREDESILDMGPETVLEFSRHIKKSQTIVWNGPLGLFEEPTFAYATISLARLIASRGKGQTFAVVGGGETIAALNQTKMEKYIDWVSTGGGAMLSFLGGEKMPGLQKLIRNF
ncbi:MAG: phosphoglycerate kinase [Patescibacteria group bacterium]